MVTMDERLLVARRRPRFDGGVIVWIRITGQWVARRKRLCDRFVERCLPTLAFGRVAVGIRADREVHQGVYVTDHVLPTN